MSTKTTKAKTDVEETPEVLDNELDRLVPVVGEPITLVDGTKVLIRPLKLRELFALLKILTRGAAMAMGAPASASLRVRKSLPKP